MKSLYLLLCLPFCLLTIAPVNLNTSYSIAPIEAKLEILSVHKETPTPVQKRARKKRRKKGQQIKKHPNRANNYQKKAGITFLILGGIFMLIMLAFFILSFPTTAWSFSIFMYIIISSVSGTIGLILSFAGLSMIKKAPKREQFLKEKIGKSHQDLAKEVPHLKRIQVRKYTKLHLKLENLKVEAEKWKLIIKEQTEKGEDTDIGVYRLKPIEEEIKKIMTQIELLRKKS